LARLRSFIKQHIRTGDAKEVLYELANGRIRPSKALADSLKGLLAAQPEFVLIDDQKEIYESAIAAARSASETHPRVLIIEGGPGTGKTVVAINLLVHLTGLGLVGKYVSKNAAPRKVYESRLVGSITRSRFSHMFTGSGGFIETEPNTFDMLIVDEAHRLNEKSGLYGNLGENQIKELIEASKCAIFFIDEDQRVTLSDIGSKQAIREFAKAKGATVEEYSLASQFRCNGSDGYLAWLDDVLDIRPTANQQLDTSQYEFKVFDTPEALHAAIAARNQDNKARVVAGYCWPWRSKKDPRQQDIVIGDYQRQWNLDQDGSLWIIAENSIEQVGCIHTCQGLEVDYIGVIIGPDLIVRDGKIITAPEQRDRHDKSIRGYKKLMKENPELARKETDLIIKNTYRTLMTRGMKGCYVFCTDEETARYFRGRGGR
ncbi:ATP-binding protein, partial [Pseudomonas aeruginosa]